MDNKKLLFKRFVFACALGVIFTGSCFGIIPAIERAGLIAIYNATDGDHWTNRSGWKTPPLDADGFAMPGTENTWYGVRIPGDHVVGLDFRNNHLVGSIPGEIEKLNAIINIYMGGNQLTSIPPQIGNLSNLYILLLDSNLLTSIPSEVGNLTELSTLNLESNKLTSIPSGIGNLKSITRLYLSNNELTSIPGEIGSMSSLIYLYLNSNRLTSIPAEIGNLPFLSTLILNNNQLSALPPQLGNLAFLEMLDLSHNELTSIPSFLLKKKVSTLSLSYNQITGAIPASILYQPDRVDLILSHNRFSGPIPSPDDTSSMNYEMLDLSNNQLSGEIPDSFFDHIDFPEFVPDAEKTAKRDFGAYGFFLSNNRLSGRINPKFGAFHNLLGLDLSNNEFTGEIPLELRNVQDLNLSMNRLSGELPSDFLKYGFFELNISSNFFSGEIPNSIISPQPYHYRTLKIEYNALYCTNPDVVNFLNLKDPDWAQTQTVIPSNISAVGKSSSSIRVSWTPVLYTADVGGYKIYKSDSEYGPWILAGTIDDKKTSFYDVTGLSSGRVYYLSVRTFTRPHEMNKNDIISGFSDPVSASTFNTSLPVISLNRSQLNFGYGRGGVLPLPQTLTVQNIGGGMLNWIATSNVTWLSITPSTGMGYGLINVSVNPVGLGDGTYTGVIAVSASNPSSTPQIVNVTLNVNSMDDIPPFGEFSTPINGTTVQGSIPVTGWTLDDVGIDFVKIYREEGEALVYIGDGVFVEGARPDVEEAYPGYPFNYKAGWGYMLLTNMLPNGGNGVFKLHVISRDLNGNTTHLGVKTISVDNAHAVKPFGALDTPAQGGMASGKNFINWGWALTPQPNIIPFDGSTIHVWIDGRNFGNPAYNVYREDIATLFPNYTNSNGAVGYSYIDTTTLNNGLHTIQWTATDNAGNTDGIGSRYFEVMNSGLNDIGVLSLSNAPQPTNTTTTPELPNNGISVQKGFNDNEPGIEILPDNTGIFHIETHELERLVIRFPYPVENESILPIGASLDKEKGVFYWMPGPGFIGTYHFSFIENDKNRGTVKKEITIKIIPRY